MGENPPVDHESSVFDRPHLLVDAGIAGSEPSLDALLQRIVETAASLTGARYAALGVIDRTGTARERFLTAGIDDEARERIGELPHGRRGNAVSAVIEDDGLGLIGMRERAALVGGRVRVESSADGGTTIAVEVPVR